MKLYVIAIRDIKANDFGPPATVPHLGSAIRNFEDQCTGVVQGDPTIKNHPEDFELYQIGWYESNTGEMTNEKTQLSAGSNYTRAS